MKHLILNHPTKIKENNLNQNLVVFLLVDIQFKIKIVLLYDLPLRQAFYKSYDTPNPLPSHNFKRNKIYNQEEKKAKYVEIREII